MSLDRVMIYRKSGRVLAAACWSCGKSDTYCDGLDHMADTHASCCEDCDTAIHNAHTGRKNYQTATH